MLSALPDGSLWLWDVQGGGEPQSLSQAGEGLVPCDLSVAALPPSTYPPSRRRLMLFAAKPAPPADEEAIAAALEAGEPPPPPEAAGPDDAQLIVLDVTPPALNLGGGAWDTAIVTTNEIRLAAFSPSKACLSSDGRFAACVLSDGKVACYHLPLPPPAPPAPPPTPTAAPAPASGKMAGGRRRGHACGAAADEASTARAHHVASRRAPRLEVSMHFLLAPAPRAVGEALSWAACGLLLWGEGARTLQQVMLPSASALSRAMSSPRWAAARARRAPTRRQSNRSSGCSPAC